MAYKIIACIAIVFALAACNPGGKLYFSSPSVPQAPASE